MSENKRWSWSWVMVGLTLVAAVALVGVDRQVGASEDHDQAHAWRRAGTVVPLAELLQRPELQGQRVLEAELEREHGQLVYELELLGDRGRVHKRYYDATSGEPLRRNGDD